MSRKNVVAHLLRLCVRGGRRLGGFSISMILMAVASLVLTPATIHAAGLHTWSSIVLAQALALILQAVAGCGYGVNGPAVIATRTRTEGAYYFRTAQRARLIVAMPCVVLMVAVMFVIPNPNPTAGLVGSAYLIIGTFSGLFFYIGRGAPRWLLFAETIPRVVMMLAGALCLALGAPLLIGLMLPAVGAALAVVLSNLTIYWWGRSTTPAESERLPKITVRGALRIQFGPTVVTVLYGGRDALPVLVVTAAAPELVAAFGVFDRLQRQAAAALSPVTSTLQGWVPKRIAAESSGRAAVVAMWVAFAGAPIVTLALALLSPYIIRWLSADTLAITCGQSILIGVVISMTMLIQILTYACLVPVGGVKAVITSNLTGIAAVLVVIPAASFLVDRSLTSVLGALVVACMMQLAVQLILFRNGLARQQFSTKHSPI